MAMQRIKCLLALVTALGALHGAAGCAAAPEVVPSSGPRPPSPPQSVKIYQKPPLRYEKLGLVVVPATKDTPWDARGNADSGFDRLKAAAAERGANGILLVVDEGQSQGTILAGYHNTFYQVPYQREPQRAGVVEAIYVLKEH